MPNLKDELHCAGWGPACGCFDGGAAAKRTKLVLPCLISSRIYVVDVGSQCRAPRICKMIEPVDVFWKCNKGYLSVTHPLPNGDVLVANMGDAAGHGKGGFVVLDGETFELKGNWENECEAPPTGHDFWYQARHNVLVSSAGMVPRVAGRGFNPDDLKKGGDTRVAAPAGLSWGWQRSVPPRGRFAPGAWAGLGLGMGGEERRVGRVLLPPKLHFPVFSQYPAFPCVLPKSCISLCSPQILHFPVFSQYPALLCDLPSCRISQFPVPGSRPSRADALQEPLGGLSPAAPSLCRVSRRGLRPPPERVEPVVPQPDAVLRPGRGFSAHDRALPAQPRGCRGLRGLCPQRGHFPLLQILRGKCGAAGSGSGSGAGEGAGAEPVVPGSARLGPGQRGLSRARCPCAERQLGRGGSDPDPGQGRVGLDHAQDAGCVCPRGWHSCSLGELCSRARPAGGLQSRLGDPESRILRGDPES
uniref:Methanethiol oxidase n=1 Tax=Junco hyemalis TaxID=40217 RepID=A0A8C5IGR1_JUNHY